MERLNIVGKAFVILLEIACFFGFLSGCNQTQVVIKAGIKRYSPAMSSTPGIPLTISCENGRILRNVNYHWTTQYGQFLRWDRGIEPLGADVKSRLNNIYWSVDFKQRKSVPDFMIQVKIKDLKSGNVFADAKLRIKKDREEYLVVPE